STPITLGAVLLRSSLMQNSSKDTSITFSLFAIPMVSANFLIDAGVYPLLLNPEMVGILGSSHELTIPCSTNCNNLRLLTTVWLRFLLANSLCFGRKSPDLLIFSRNQLYSSRCGRNSRVQKE